MKKFLNIFAALLLAVVSTSCLEHDLEELDLHSGCDVTNGNVYYRYISDEVHPGTGENKVKQVYLAAARTQDLETNTYTIRYVTDNIPAEKRATFQESAVVVLTISTAAIVKPVGDAPTLGVPGNWTKDNQYDIVAADGTTKRWTIHIEPYQ